MLATGDIIGYLRDDIPFSFWINVARNFLVIVKLVKVVFYYYYYYY